MACVSMQVQLNGGSQRHPDTQQYHTGISYIRATGTPVYNFELVSWADASHDQPSRILDDLSNKCEQHVCTDAPGSSIIATRSANQSWAVALRYIKYDDLVQTGGLRAKSERGRLLREHDVDSDGYEDFCRYPSEDIY